MDVRAGRGRVCGMGTSASTAASLRSGPRTNPIRSPATARLRVPSVVASFLTMHIHSPTEIHFGALRRVIADNRRPAAHRKQLLLLPWPVFCAKRRDVSCWTLGRWTLGWQAPAGTNQGDARNSSWSRVDPAPIRPPFICPDDSLCRQIRQEGVYREVVARHRLECAKREHRYCDIGSGHPIAPATCP